MLINIFGRRGSGKTTTIRYQLKDCRPPILIVDVLGNFENKEFLKQRLPWEVEQATELDEALEKIVRYSKGEYSKKELARMPGGKFTLNLKTSDPTTAADYFSAAIWAHEDASGKPLGGTLILDEVDSIDIEEGSCFDEYIRYGRNHHGDLITGCRRPAELSRNITAGANKFYCFQTHEFRDIDYFRANVFGDRAEELAHLPDFHGLYLNYDTKRIGKYLINRQGAIYHLSETPLRSQGSDAFGETGETLAPREDLENHDRPSRVGSVRRKFHLDRDHRASQAAPGSRGDLTSPGTRAQPNPATRGKP